jgi:hypothetical protein
MELTSGASEPPVNIYANSGGLDVPEVEIISKKELPLGDRSANAIFTLVVPNFLFSSIQFSSSSQSSLGVVS